MDIKYVIPSYGRPDALNSKTLLTLHNMKIDPSNIYVFVVAEEEDLYRNTLIKAWYGHIVVGVKGITAQRQFISDYFPEGEYIVSFDDDIESIDMTLTNWNCLTRAIEDAFIVCLQHKAFIWGTYPSYNRYFRENRNGIYYGINFIIGHFYGYINRHDKDLHINPENTQKEDFERSIRYFMKDGITVRFDRVGCKTKYMANKGGLGKRKERIDAIEVDTKRLHEEFPEYTKLKQRKNGLFEVILYDGKLKKPEKMLSVSNIAREEPVWLDPVAPEELQPLWQALEKIKIPYQSGTSGRAATFNKHRACTMGLIKPRGKKDFTLTAATKKWPEIAKMIYDLGKRICKVPFTSIHINESVCCPPHYDPVNSRDSTIISFGNYKGLLLEIENLGTFDTWCHPLQFSGSQHKHWNTALESGKKYSLVFFYHDNPEKIDSDNGLGELINQQLAVKSGWR